MFRVKETINQFEDNDDDSRPSSSISNLSDYVSDNIEKRVKPNYKPHENRVVPRIDFYWGLKENNIK